MILDYNDYLQAPNSYQTDWYVASYVGDGAQVSDTYVRIEEVEITSPWIRAAEITSPWDREVETTSPWLVEVEP